LRDSQRNQKFLVQDFAGSGKRKQILFHG
jgi:hypothetical protein